MSWGGLQKRNFLVTLPHDVDVNEYDLDEDVDDEDADDGNDNGTGVREGAGRHP